MGEHLIAGEFQSDKYPSTPRGKVPLSCRDPMAQDLLWAYSIRRRAVDAEFSSDLQEALRIAGYNPRRWLEDPSKATTAELIEWCRASANVMRNAIRMDGGTLLIECGDPAALEAIAAKLATLQRLQGAGG